MIDYTAFFNPAAVSWGSWSPPARGMVSPQVTGSPMAPAPAGNIGMIPATPSPVSPPAPVAQPRPNPPAMPIPGGMPPPNPPATSLLDSLKAATAYGQSGYKGPTGDIGYGTGVGASGPIPAAPTSEGLPGLFQGLGKLGQNPNFGSLLQKAALGFQPQQQQINAPPLQMAQPVGPGNYQQMLGMLNQRPSF